MGKNDQTKGRHPDGCRHHSTPQHRGCRDWPSPDPVGRRCCDRCGCFTARSYEITTPATGHRARVWRHGWCEPGPKGGTSTSPAGYLDRIVQENRT